jgi:hypothetical protein
MFLAEKAAECDVTLATTEAYQREFLGIGVKFVTIGRGGEESLTGVRFRLRQIRLLIEVARLMRTNVYGECIVLTFDTVALALCARLLGSPRIAVINHKNVDELASSALKRLAFRLIPSHVVHYCYESYIADYLTLCYSKTCAVIPHGLRVMEVTPRPVGSHLTSTPYVFCPSGECSSAFLKRLVEFCVDRDMTLLAKPNAVLVGCANVVVKKYFDDYDALFLGAEYVAVGVAFQYRVSGVFYEAVANEKSVIFNDCLFARSVADQLGGDPIFLSG